ncbi:membrane protein insertion efficiency factor YidD [Nocardia yamanashiensis]|uniref:membrane protein insertion efficiency factor YidD n=1 Tax=Nocardia yamanashiensis TaxID=209247 RepID=UPI000A038F41|nr:membrane protein insertion efficiency factor YidD [Nocardia yamanashiensis]UGT40495.1 membrane protein insertion efficiency factor YidD [Nocardia yamanashiensis]
MNAFRAAVRLPAKALIFLIELYRTYISPTRMPVCRFTPTCSEYAVTALRTRGLFVGLGLATVRLAKCAPWHPGGWDPVPEPRRVREEQARRDAASAFEGSSPAVTGDTNDGSA